VYAIDFCGIWLLFEKCTDNVRSHKSWEDICVLLGLDPACSCVMMSCVRNVTMFVWLTLVLGY